MKLIVATNIPFWRKSNGAEERINMLLDHLSTRGFTPTIFNTAHFDDHPLNCRFSLVRASSIEAKRGAFFRLACQAGGWLRSLKPSRISARFLRSQRSKRFVSWQDMISDCEVQAFAHLLRRERPDVVIIEYIWLTRLVSNLSPELRRQCPFLLDAHDCIHERTEHITATGTTPARGVTADDERLAISNFDLVLAITDRDASSFRSLCPDTPVITVPHGQLVRQPPPPPKFKTLLFVGSRNQPNIEGLRAFLAEVWPKLLNQFGGEIRLDIVGTIERSRNLLPKADQTHFLGIVESLRPHYDQAYLTIAPLPWGTGLKIKVVDALCHARPLVTTDAGAQGLQDGTGEAFLVAGNWDQFASHCSTILRDPALAERLAERAYKYASEHFAPPAAYANLTHFLETKVIPHRTD